MAGNTFEKIKLGAK